MIHRISGLKMPEEALECFGLRCYDCSFGFEEGTIPTEVIDLCGIIFAGLV